MEQTQAPGMSILCSELGLSGQRETACLRTTGDKGSGGGGLRRDRNEEGDQMFEIGDQEIQLGGGGSEGRGPVLVS